MLPINTAKTRVELIHEMDENVLGLDRLEQKETKDQWILDMCTVLDSWTLKSKIKNYLINKNEK